MSDDNKRYSPVASSSHSSRRKRDDDVKEEEPREKVAKRYTPPERERQTKYIRDRSTGSVSEIDEKRTSDSRQPKSRAVRYEIVHTRPETVGSKEGSSGDKILLETNYFKILKRPEWSIYQYRVDFIPEIEFKRLKCGIMSEHKSLFGSGYLFDGTLLYVTNKLPENITEIAAKSRAGDEYKIVIKFVSKISMAQWQFLQILNLILRRAMEGLQLQLVGRNFYDALAKINMPQHKLQLWPGYITSIRQHENDVLLCAEITHKVMRTETIYDILRQCINESKRRGVDWMEDFRKQVIGLIVLTDYNNKTYRIDDVDLDCKASNTFDMKGKQTSFIDYYLQKYRIRIRDPNQPLLASRNSENGKNKKETKVLLIPELCRVTGLSENMRTNNFLMKEVANFTKTNPDRRIEILKKFNRRLQDTEVSQEVLRDWNLSLDRNLVRLTGRKLNPEKICFKDNDKESATDRGDWSNHCRNKGMFTVAYLNRWAVVYQYKFKHEYRDFIGKLFTVANGMQMRIETPYEIVINDDRNNSFINGLDKAAVKDPKLILCFVPNKNVERYSLIKKKCCVDRAIPTQIVVQGTVSASKRVQMSIITKIVIQMNAKLGGAPWMVSIPMKGLMVIGFDICKSKKDRSKAYAALVATMDQKIETRYFSTVSETHSCDSVSSEINLCVGKALHEYNRTHKCLPEKIILYRDGVGNGQLNQVFQVEVKSLVEFFETTYTKLNLPPPRFTFMVVSKQINARFFANGRNPDPGTIVDNTVTLPESYDFYLVSQSVRQGTVSPTSYNILYDTSNLCPDKLQILTYKMCHLYYNWAGTTRVPAVCQYAKKLANLVGQFIYQTPSDILEKQLYYL